MSARQGPGRDPGRISRRAFLASGALLPLGGLAAAQENPWARLLKEYDSVRPPTYEAVMPLPRLAAARSEYGADVFELTMKRGLARPLPGAATEIWGYDGLWPGPTLLVTRGRPARARLRNELDENMTVHNHGHRAPPDSDGHPVDYVRPGATREYLYPNRQAAGTYWYHDHAHGLTGPHVYRGLAGFYIIRDPAEEALGLPSGGFDVPVLLQDRIFDAAGALSYAVNAGTIFNGFLGNTLCVNGVHVPRFEVAARRYRFRFLNGSNARNYRLALDPAQPLIQVGSDGGLLAAPVSRPAVDLAPAERCDCVIDFAAFAGRSVFLRNLDPTWPALPDVLRFDVGPATPDPSRVPARLAEIPRLDPARARVTRVVSFQLSDGKWTMNGLRYDPARIDFRPKLGTVEVWELQNREPTQMHPFHQHLVQFQVLGVNGAPPPPELGGFKDTVAVPPGGTVRIIMEFTGYAGVYVFHCHKLEHEDHDMMLQQEVMA